MSQADDVFKTGFIEQQDGYGVQAVEPAAGLVDRLTDIVRREPPVLEQRFVLKRIMTLGDWHRPGIEPAVDNLRDTLHHSTAFSAIKGKFIDVGTVQVQGFLEAGKPPFLFKVVHPADTLEGAAGLAAPDRQRCAPVALT